MPIKTIEVTFLDKFDRTHAINYWIDDNDLSKRWLSMIEQNKNDSNKLYHSYFANALPDDIPDLQVRINDILSNLNKGYNLPAQVGLDGTLTQSELNDLHEQFEEYGGRVTELHDNFLELNELIHTCEDLFARKNSENFPVMHCTMDFYPQEIFTPLLDKDRLLIKSDYKWGNLYLGYNTLGKDWIGIWIDNDLEVIERDMVQPQQRFSAETWFHFGPDDFNNYNIRKFYEWYHNLPIDLQKKVPIDNLNELSFGRVWLGGVIIDDYFLKFDSNKNNWLIPNSQTKHDWNQQVFNSFRKIVKIVQRTDA